MATIINQLGVRNDGGNSKWRKTVGGTVTNYLLDDQGNEVAEYDGSGNRLRTLVYDPAQTAPIATLDPSGVSSYTVVDRLGSVVANSQHFGSTDLLANTYAYLPYGETPSGTLAGTAFGFAGYRFDAETGTYNSRTRSYDPRLGRWIQTDPAGQAAGRNTFAYTDSDPLNATDLSGLDCCGDANADGGSAGYGGGGGASGYGGNSGGSATPDGSVANGATGVGRSSNGGPAATAAASTDNGSSGSSIDEGASNEIGRIAADANIAADGSHPPPLSVADLSAAIAAMSLRTYVVDEVAQRPQ